MEYNVEKKFIEILIGDKRRKKVEVIWEVNKK